MVVNRDLGNIFIDIIICIIQLFLSPSFATQKIPLKRVCHTIYIIIEPFGVLLSIFELFRSVQNGSEYAYNSFKPLDKFHFFLYNSISYINSVFAKAFERKPVTVILRLRELLSGAKQ